MRPLFPLCPAVGRLFLYIFLFHRLRRRWIRGEREIREKKRGERESKIENTVVVVFSREFESLIRIPFSPLSLPLPEQNSLFSTFTLTMKERKCAGTIGQGPFLFLSRTLNARHVPKKRRTLFVSFLLLSWRNFSFLVPV